LGKPHTEMGETAVQGKKYLLTSGYTLLSERSYYILEEIIADGPTPFVSSCRDGDRSLSKLQYYPESIDGQDRTWRFCSICL